MVKHLLNIIRLQSRNASNPPQATADRDKAQKSSIRSTVTRMGLLLTQSCHNTLSFVATPRTPHNSRQRVIHEVTPNSQSPSDSSSPIRTRKSAQRLSQSDESTGQTPRRGEKSKQRRVDPGHYTCDHDKVVGQWQSFKTEGFGFHGKPTTELLGWRRLHVEEIVRLEEGSFIFVLIPSHIKNEARSIVHARNAFANRVNEAQASLNRNVM